MSSQFEPKEYDKKYEAWRYEDLPIIPKWQLKVSDGCVEQFKIIQQLISKADEIVNAGDPDREGQLLVDEILDYVGNTKPVKRILLNALDEKSVRAALSNLQDNNKFLGLRQSALARSRADWLVGMNLSRAYTIKAKQAGYRKALKVGRVKTPTMSLVVRREEEIANFKPVDFYNIIGNFSNGEIDFLTNWTINDECSGLDSENRLVDINIANNILAKFLSGDRRAVIKQIDTTEKKEGQRLPYSLSSLQVDAGKKYDYAPQLVLDTMQELYEKKLTTYPRSDCEYLPENQLADVNGIINNLSQFQFDDVALFASKAKLNIKSRAWNDKKISAHHAIIPTTVACNLETLTDVQRNLYSMVAKSYIAQFYDLYIYRTTKIIVSYMNDEFTSTGKTIMQVGWKRIYPAKENENLIPDLSQGEIISLTDVVQ